MFSMRHLQVFLAVVDAGCSVSAAAEKLHVAQPAVSKTLADLDAHFGTVLFERLNRRLRLSEAGARLLVEARQLVDSFTLLDHGMRLGTDRLPLRVGATHTVGAVFLPRLLVRRDAGACPLEVQVFNTHQVERSILDSSLDVGVVEGSIVSADIRQQVVAQDEVIAVAAPGVNKTDVLIVREPGSGTRDAALAKFATPESRLWSVASSAAMVALAEAGQGVAVLSAQLVARELAAGTLVRFGRTGFRRTFRLVYHKDKFMDSRMDAFTRLCRARAEGR